MSPAQARLNYHHLYHFWAVAKEGHLTRAAERIGVAQSALSTQIRQLEGQLGQALFSRKGRSLVLTEAGRIALAYAETIVTAGNELVATIREGQQRAQQVLRVAAVATLSRNFQRDFLAPLFRDPDLRLVLQSGSLAELLPQLRAHTLDLVLSNRRVHEDEENAWRCRRIARQPVSLVGPPRRQPFRFPADLALMPMVLPSRDHDIRTAFDRLCEQHGLRVTIAAEVDDMAMLRHFALAGNAMTLVPAVVVQDELRAGELEVYCTVPAVFETFYAISVRRQYEHPLLVPLLDRSEAEVLAIPD
ncbi:MAG: LysR family transcriptional regulator [Candidatus Sericytochromatia bacterium]|nr:LysR family transcriptional regulator [Candidatus Sericytochromatia bacterium]